MSNYLSDYKIYVACLASYNSGKLHGEWLDLDSRMSGDDIFTEIKEKVLDTSSEPFAEEWAIHDYDLGGIRIDEYESLSDVAGIVELLEEHNNDDLVSEVYNYYSGIEETKDALSQNYQGTYRSLGDWAEQYLADTGGLEALSEQLQYYFDFDAYGRNEEQGGSIFTIDTKDGLAVFYHN